MRDEWKCVCRSREAERLKMKRGRIREDVRKARAEGGEQGDARYSASEGVLACSFFTVSHIISHWLTHSQTYTRLSQCQEAEQTCI